MDKRRAAQGGAELVCWHGNSHGLLTPRCLEEVMERAWLRLCMRWTTRAIFTNILPRMWRPMHLSFIHNLFFHLLCLIWSSLYFHSVGFMIMAYHSAFFLIQYNNTTIMVYILTPISLCLYFLSVNSRQFWWSFPWLYTLTPVGLELVPHLSLGLTVTFIL